MIPEIALIEIACVLTRAKILEETIDKWITWLRSFILIAGIEETYPAPKTLEVMSIAKKTGCRAGDVFYVSLAQKYKFPLASFDKDQLNRAKKIKITVAQID